MSRKGEKNFFSVTKGCGVTGTAKTMFPNQLFFSLSYCCFVFQRMEKTESNMLRNSRSSVEAEAQRKVKNVKS